MRVLSLGWGVQSFTLAAMSALGKLPRLDAAIHADTGHEMTWTYAFREEWSPWLAAHGIRVVVCTPVERSRPYLLPKAQGTLLPAYTVGKKKGRLTRQCTRNWKIEPIVSAIRELIEEYNLKLLPGVIEQWLGISTDEWQRAHDNPRKYITNTYPLLDINMSRQDCIVWLKSHGLEVPNKSSCTFCPYHSKAGWSALKHNGGHDWAEAQEVDTTIRNIKPNYQTYLHQSALPLDEAIRIRDVPPTQLDLLASDDQDAQCDSGACFL